MKVLVTILAFLTLAFAQNAQNQPTQSVQPAPQAQNAPQQMLTPMPYPNQGVPQNIIAKVQQMYPGAFITDMDYEGWGYEVEVNDHLELFFDNNGNLLGQKWD